MSWMNEPATRDFLQGLAVGLIIGSAFALALSALHI